MDSIALYPVISNCSRTAGMQPVDFIKSTAFNEAALKSLVESHSQDISNTFETKCNDYFSQ